MSIATDTIAAIATPAGRGALGILRLSGPLAPHIAERIAGALPPPRQAALRHFRDADGSVIDQGLVLVFPGPHSFTGEDVVELQGHGGPVLLDLLLRSACAHGARVARPGEFSERAFLNDRIDLAQAEAIADLIDAASVQAARAASRSLDGEFSRRVNALVEELIQLRVFVEGALDFSDEDVDWLADARLRERLDALDAHLRGLLAQAAQGRRLREGITVTLTGAPNVGKSTLLNRLAGTDAAIVTDIAGTTRDVLRESLVLDGMPLTLVDTAGLRESDDPVEREGIRRAWQALAQAEIALYLIDDTAGWTPQDEALAAQLPPQARVLVLANKCDLSGRKAQRLQIGGRDALRLSAADGSGVPLLIAAIREIAGLGDATEHAFSARTRHVDALRRAQASVHDARKRLDEGATPELAAEELRLAQDALSEITGAFGSDDLLGRVFSQFCIGK
ncbi:MAG: tRNA uridine-5-carboxymethylaminomethyl(34) synthesis GTPase MnmE [Nevskiaceae bacterium]|nr:MAG: tRNA uridine-5-carboxymethylaminomethyl(34) synthesis GTPase MnmE [Nevskiaceae bacterium]